MQHGETQLARHGQVKGCWVTVVALLKMTTRHPAQHGPLQHGLVVQHHNHLAVVVILLPQSLPPIPSFPLPPLIVVIPPPLIPINTSRRCDHRFRLSLPVAVVVVSLRRGHNFPKTYGVRPFGQPIHLFLHGRLITNNPIIIHSQHPHHLFSHLHYSPPILITKIYSVIISKTLRIIKILSIIGHYLLLPTIIPLIHQIPKLQIQIYFLNQVFTYS